MATEQFRPTNCEECPFFWRDKGFVKCNFYEKIDSRGGDFSNKKFPFCKVKSISVEVNNVD